MTESREDSLLPVTETGGPARAGKWSATAVEQAGEAWGGSKRYEDQGLLGAGGMGEVRLLRDSTIGREVAVKRLHAKDAKDELTRSRFVREARLQGRLEHPSIVPVYDLGVEAGDAFFTMKRVKGVTLRQILKGYRNEDEEMMEKYSRRRLLSDFVRVCLAVDFAHERGIVHRDLKPSNVMLGEYGEVYVLDWGIAKAADHPEDERTMNTSGALAETTGTQVGSVVGTPGFIPPERILSAGDGRDPRSDIYALGCILFEILAGEPVYRMRTIDSVIQETLDGVDARPSERSPSEPIAPELEKICVRATAKLPEERFDGVRALSTSIEAYLDGARDVEARRRLAEARVKEANTATAAALAAGGEPKIAARLRTDAMQKVGRALALDPNNEGALRSLYHLFTTVPDEPPEETQREFEALSQEKLRFALRMGAFIYLAWLVAFPLAMWMGVRDWTHVGGMAGLALTASFLSFWASRMRHIDVHVQYAVLITSSLAMFMASRMFGPLVLVPSVLAVNTMSFAMTEVKLRRAAFIAVGCLALLVPTCLELAGVFPPSYGFEELSTGGRMLIFPQMLAFPETTPLIALLVLSLLTIVTPAIAAGFLRDKLTLVERRLLTQHWYLRQLLPAGNVEKRPRDGG